LEAFLPRFFAGAREELAKKNNSQLRHVNKNQAKPKTEVRFTYIYIYIFFNLIYFLGFGEEIFIFCVQKRDYFLPIL